MTPEVRARRYRRKPTFICDLGSRTGEYYVWNELHRSEITLKVGDMVRVDDPNDTYPIDRQTFEATYEPVD